MTVHEELLWRYRLCVNFELLQQYQFMIFASSNDFKVKRRWSKHRLLQCSDKFWCNQIQSLRDNEVWFVYNRRSQAQNLTVYSISFMTSRSYFILAGLWTVKRTLKQTLRSKSTTSALLCWRETVCDRKSWRYASLITPRCHTVSLSQHRWYVYS